MELKRHYKMYKAGKKWTFAAIATISIIAGLNTVTVTTHAANNNDPQQAITQNAPNNSSDPEATTTQNTAKNSSDPQATTTQNTAKNSSDPQATTTQNTAKNSSDPQATTTQNTAKNSSDPQAATTQNTAKNSNDPQATTTQNTVSTADIQVNQSVNLLGKQSTVTSTGYNDSHIKNINGKIYFVGDNGQVKKNFTAIINGQSLYFNKTTGELASNDVQYENGLVKINDIHNAAYSIDPTGFTNVDGFLTANSWYRPKYIYKDGQRWAKSTSQDLRPLLMTWWPDKNTQVAYLQYMQKKGILPVDVAISNQTSQSVLTKESFNAQAGIEKQIGAMNGNTDWLKKDVSDFVNSQPNWNIDSEAKGTDHLQGGALLYPGMSI